MDSSPRRSSVDDNEDDVDEVDERRLTQGTSTVTSRSGSPAVDSTTTDYCSLIAGDTKTPPADRSNEPQHDDTAVLCSDEAASRQDVSSHSEHEHPTVDHDVNRISGMTSVVAAAADTVEVVETPPSETENNLARLEIMTCIAGGNVDQRHNSSALQVDFSLRPRRGHGGLARSSTTSRTAGGRRARPTQSRTRNSTLMAACGRNGRPTVTCDMSSYRTASLFDGSGTAADKNYVDDLRQESRDISRGLEPTLAFPGSTYTDTGRCLYADLTADGLFPSEVYPHSPDVTAAGFHQLPRPYAVPTDNHFRTPVRNCGDRFTPFPLPTSHSSASFPVCNAAGLPTWKDWRWNDCGQASAVDYDDQCFVVDEQFGCRPSSVETRAGWTNRLHDVRYDVDRRTSSTLTRRCESTCCRGDCPVAEYVPYGHSDRVMSQCSMVAMPSSRFYDSQCCYVPTSNSLFTAAEAGGHELMPRQSSYQSCKYSGVADAHCRQYNTTDDSACLQPPFVNTA